MTSQLTYSQESSRIELDGYGFHSGDPLEVLILTAWDKPVWVKTRIEYSHSQREWYLVDLAGLKLPGLFARRID